MVRKTEYPLSEDPRAIGRRGVHRFITASVGTEAGMTSEAVAQVPQGKLARKITGPLLFLFILGDVLGAGIYALMGVLAGEVGGALWAPLLAALLLALLTAGSYAELVTKYPKAGGAAVFAERAFRRPLVSFLVGFCMLAAGVTSAAGLSLAFAGDYLATFMDASGARRRRVSDCRGAQRPRDQRIAEEQRGPDRHRADRPADRDRRGRGVGRPGRW